MPPPIALQGDEPTPAFATNQTKNQLHVRGVKLCRCRFYSQRPYSSTYSTVLYNHAPQSAANCWCQQHQPGYSTPAAAKTATTIGSKGLAKQRRHTITRPLCGTVQLHITFNTVTLATSGIAINAFATAGGQPKRYTQASA